MFHKTFILTLGIIGFMLPGTALAANFLAAPHYAADLKSSIENTISGVRDQKGFWEDTILDEVAFNIAQNLSDRMVRSVVDWANNGFKSVGEDGQTTTAPFFVTDWDQLFRDIAGEETANLVDALQDSDNPFATQIVQSLTQDFQAGVSSQFTYTLDSLLGIEPHDQFINGGNFSAGGWQGYLEQGLSNNNPAGLWLQSLNAQYASVEEKIDNARTRLIANQGFQDQRECSDVRERNDGTSYCAIYAVTTPGSIVEEKLVSALTTPEKNAAEIDQWGQLLARSLTNLTDGLTQVGVSKINVQVQSSISDLFAPNIIAEEDFATPVSGGSIGDDYYLGDNFTEVININKTLYGTPATPDDPATSDIDESTTGTEGVLITLEEEIVALQETIDIIRSLPPQLYQLDVCLPGPDQGWEQRLSKKFETATDKLFRKINRNDNDSQEDYYATLNTALPLLQQFMQITTLNADPNQSIDGTFAIKAYLSQGKKYTSEISTLLDEMTRKLTLKSELNQVWNQWNEPDLTPSERTQLLQTFKILTNDLSYGESSSGTTAQLIAVKHLQIILGQQLNHCQNQRDLIYGDVDTLADTWINSGSGPLGPFESIPGILDPFNAAADQVVDSYNELYDANDPEVHYYCNQFLTEQATDSEFESILYELTTHQNGYDGLYCSQFYFADITDYYPVSAQGLF